MSRVRRRTLLHLGCVLAFLIRLPVRLSDQSTLYLTDTVLTDRLSRI